MLFLYKCTCMHTYVHTYENIDRDYCKLIYKDEKLFKV